jgi:hypothetical protein
MKYVVRITSWKAFSICGAGGSSSSEVGPCETAGDAKTVHALVALADRQAASSSACQTATIQGSNRHAQSLIQHILYQCIYI